MNLLYLNFSRKIQSVSRGSLDTLGRCDCEIGGGHKALIITPLFSFLLRLNWELSKLIQHPAWGGCRTLRSEEMMFKLLMFLNYCCLYMLDPIGSDRLQLCHR